MLTIGAQCVCVVRLVFRHDAGIVKHFRVADRIQAMHARLGKQMTKDQVGHLLESRPGHGALVSQGP